MAVAFCGKPVTPSLGFSSFDGSQNRLIGACGEQIEDQWRVFRSLLNIEIVQRS